MYIAKEKYNAYGEYITSLEYALDLLLQEANLEYETQKRFGKCVVDAYVPKYNMVVEADGDYWHRDKDYETKRDTYLLNMGITTIVHLNDNDLDGWLIT